MAPLEKGLSIKGEAVSYPLALSQTRVGSWPASDPSTRIADTKGNLVCEVCYRFHPGDVAPHLQQRPFITLGALVAFLLLSIHGVVDSGEVVAEYGQHGPAHPLPSFL